MPNYCSELKITRFDWLFDVTTRLRWTRANKIRFHQCQRRTLLLLTRQHLSHICRTGNLFYQSRLCIWLICCFNFRALSPLPRGPHSMAVACASPIETLPHTVFPNDYHQQRYQPQQLSQPKPEQHVNYPPPPPPRTCFSPQLTRDHFQSTFSDDESSALQNQVSATLS